MALPIRNLKIVCGALLGGAVLLGLVLCSIVDFAKLSTEPKMLVLMASTIGVAMFMMSVVLFKMLAGQTRAKTDSLKSHFNVLHSAWIVRFAIVGAACFLNLMVTILHQSLITLFVAVLGILFMLLAFPRTQVVEKLLQERMKS